MSNKIGILAVGRDCSDVASKVLAPFYEVAKSHNLYFCLLSASFIGTEKFNGPEPDPETVTELVKVTQTNPTNTFFMTLPEYVSETTLRDIGRKQLSVEGCDIIWMIDLSDEYYTVDQIHRIVKFIESNPLTSWFKLSFKNYVFDKDTYLKQPFQPPRIYRVKTHSTTFFGLGIKELTLSRLWDDNNFFYQDDSGKEVRDIELPNLIIPPAVAWIRHESWLNNERSKMKIRYQLEGRGWPICSFKWDDTNGLQFNENYYKGDLPEIGKD